MDNTGLIHIYTGDGKGKTTAAVGLAIRALGHNLSVVYSSFMKRPDLYGYHEINILEKLGAKVYVFTEGHPHFNKEISADKLKSDIQDALSELAGYIKEEEIDLLIMDEILITIRDGFLPEVDLINFIQSKPNNCELVMTGRGATEKVKEFADYVTNMTMIKHPFEKGIPGREGIEF